MYLKTKLKLFRGSIHFSDTKLSSVCRFSMASKHFQFSKTITSIYNITACKMFVLSMCCGCQQMRMCIEQRGNEASMTPHLHCSVFYAVTHIPLWQFCKVLLIKATKCEF